MIYRLLIALACAGGLLAVLYATRSALRERTADAHADGPQLPPPAATAMPPPPTPPPGHPVPWPIAPESQRPPPGYVHPHAKPPKPPRATPLSEAEIMADVAKQLQRAGSIAPPRVAVRRSLTPEQTARAHLPGGGALEMVIVHCDGCDIGQFFSRGGRVEGDVRTDDYLMLLYTRRADGPVSVSHGSEQALTKLLARLGNDRAR